MIKRPLYFGNPPYLKTTNEQMVVEMQDPANDGTGTGEIKRHERQIIEFF